MLARKMTVPSAARHASPHRLRVALSSLMTLSVMAAPARADEPASAPPPEPPKPAAEIGDDLDEVVEPAPPTRASYEDDHATSRSHLVPVSATIGAIGNCSTRPPPNDAWTAEGRYASWAVGLISVRATRSPARRRSRRIASSPATPPPQTTTENGFTAVPS